MAIFEKTSHTKALIDDTEKLSCTVENAQNINKHTEYILRVQRGPSKDNMWNVSRRYRDFAALHAGLLQANIDLPIPPKKLIGNMQPAFIAERQIALQNYINEVLSYEVLALSLQVRSFLDPTNYPLDIAEFNWTDVYRTDEMGSICFLTDFKKGGGSLFDEQALQTVSIALRGDGRYELKGPLPEIGWRIRKHYFLVTDTESRTNCMLSYQSYGADRYLSDKDLQTAFKSLMNLSHPHIDPVLAIQNLETGAYVVRKIHEFGSLRDILYGTEYNKNHLAKYGNPRIRKPFTLGQLAHYGYQILVALKFLHEKGIPHGHIHPGNIAIENQRALLMDIENILIGVPCLYRPHLLQLRRGVTAEAIDVYCFGRTLYEMAVGCPLTDYYCDHFESEQLLQNEDLESVLRMCLSKISCKHGGPTIDNLLQHQFFVRAPLNGLTAIPHYERLHLKFPIALKDELKMAVTNMESRLKTEQKSVRSAKREVRIQEILGSEEEIKKQKRRAKKRDSLWKSTSSLAETVRSQSASTASSPTPPALSHDSDSRGPGARTPGGGGASPCDARSSLLAAICAFDKTRLANVVDSR